MSILETLRASGVSAQWLLLSTEIARTRESRNFEGRKILRESLDIVNLGSLKDSWIDISLDHRTEESGIQRSRQTANMQWESHQCQLGMGQSFLSSSCGVLVRKRLTPHPASTVAHKH